MCIVLTTCQLDYSSARKAKMECRNISKKYEAFDSAIRFLHGCGIVRHVSSHTLAQLLDLCCSNLDIDTENLGDHLLQDTQLEIDITNAKVFS